MIRFTFGDLWVWELNFSGLAILKLALGHLSDLLLCIDDSTLLILHDLDQFRLIIIGRNESKDSDFTVVKVLIISIGGTDRPGSNLPIQLPRGPQSST